MTQDKKDILHALAVLSSDKNLAEKKIKEVISRKTASKINESEEKILRKYSNTKKLEEFYNNEDVRAELLTNIADATGEKVEESEFNEKLEELAVHENIEVVIDLLSESKDDDCDDNDDSDDEDSEDGDDDKDDKKGKKKSKKEDDSDDDSDDEDSEDEDEDEDDSNEKDDKDEK